MELCDGLDDGKPQPRSRLPSGGIGPVEGLKGLGKGRLGQLRGGIFHIEAGFAGLMGIDPDPDGATLRGILHRIGIKKKQNLARNV